MSNIKVHDPSDDSSLNDNCRNIRYMPGATLCKRRRLEKDSPNSSVAPTILRPPPENELTPLCEWPDDIIIHLLQFLDFETLVNFDLTCRRIRCLVKHSLKHLLEPVILSLPLSDEIQSLVKARDYLIPSPPRYSFSYVRLLQGIYADFQTIEKQANPIKKCPREELNTGIDYNGLTPSYSDHFRSSYCYYFSQPIRPIAHFWTIFWEYKRLKAINPDEFKEKVAKWAWERYSYRDILGVARFNGCYYSRIITSSLACQRDALQMVLEIYKTRDSTHESWSVNEGLPILQWKLSLSRNSECEYRTGLNCPGIERLSVVIPVTVTVSARITPSESSSSHVFVSHLSGLDLALSRLADFGTAYNATIDRAWETRNTHKMIEYQDFFDFIWGELMGERAANKMSEELNKYLDVPSS